jgi:dihydroorotate dehydrogenase
MRLVGVGGIFNAEDVRKRLIAGAHHVQIATAAMLDPEIGISIRSSLSRLLQVRVS